MVGNIIPKSVSFRRGVGFRDLRPRVCFFEHRGHTTGAESAAGILAEHLDLANPTPTELLMMGFGFKFRNKDLEKRDLGYITVYLYLQYT